MKLRKIIIILFLIIFIFSLVFLSGCYSGGGKTGVVRGGCVGGLDATAAEAAICEKMSYPGCEQNSPPCCFKG